MHLLVVYPVHSNHHALASFSGVHQFYEVITTERQNTALGLPLSRDHRVLLHLRCRGVSHCLEAIPHRCLTSNRDARRIWFWRHSPLILTGLICFFFGGIVSEIVQSLLPVRRLAWLAHYRPLI